MKTNTKRNVSNKTVFTGTIFLYLLAEAMSYYFQWLLLGLSLFILSEHV